VLRSNKYKSVLLERKTIMAKTIKERTHREIEKLATADGFHSVGGAPGLYLQVKGNSRAWVLYATIAGKRQKIGLGSYQALSLANARSEARKLHAEITAGGNPIHERKAEKARAILEAAKNKTFKECAEMFIESQRAGWKPGHAARYESSLAIHVYPIIGELSIADINADLVLKVLRQPVKTTGGKETLWTAKNDTASRLRGRIESVFDYADALKFREGRNPADWKILRHTLPAKNKVYEEKHFPALSYAEIGAFMAELRKREGMAARGLEFSVLTAARSQEMRRATWTEIDFDKRLWTVPGGRDGHMKTGKEHYVPLSDAAIELLKSLPRQKGNNHIFPPPVANEMSDMAVSMVIRRMHAAKQQTDGVGWIDPKEDNRVITAHGFRSTFRDWAGETTSYQREAIEHALAHKLPDKVESAYARETMLTKRRNLMRDWARYCDGLPIDNVIAFPVAV
jgi:integrase